jgi:hypothetical protein
MGLLARDTQLSRPTRTDPFRPPRDAVAARDGSDVLLIARRESEPHVGPCALLEAITAASSHRSVPSSQVVFVVVGSADLGQIRRAGMEDDGVVDQFDELWREVAAGPSDDFSISLLLWTRAFPVTRERLTGLVPMFDVMMIACS